MPPQPAEDAGATSGPAGLETALAELSRIVLDRPLEQVLRRVVVLAASALPGTELSVTLLTDDRVTSPAASSAAASALDQRQGETGEGPCLDAARTGGVVRAHLAVGDTYPRLRDLALHHGVRSSASLALATPPRVQGALNLYSRSEDVPADHVAHAGVFASYATVAVVHAHLPHPAAGSAARLQEALRTRAVVAQAAGVLAARLDLDVDAAAEHLAETARRSGTSVAEVAAEVVDRARRRDES